jgi:hypothetical protein
METKGKYDKIDLLIRTNIKKSADWCIKHGVPYNIFPMNSNIFISEN